METKKRFVCMECLGLILEKDIEILSIKKFDGNFPCDYKTHCCNKAVKVIEIENERIMKYNFIKSSLKVNGIETGSIQISLLSENKIKHKFSFETNLKVSFRNISHKKDIIKSIIKNYGILTFGVDYNDIVNAIDTINVIYTQYD